MQSKQESRVTRAVSEIIHEVNRLFHACQHRRNKFNPNNSGNILILYVNTVKDVNDLTDFYSAF